MYRGVYMKILSQKIRSHGKKAVMLKKSKKNIRSKNGAVNIVVSDNPQELYIRSKNGAVNIATLDNSKGASIRLKNGMMSHIPLNLIGLKKNMNVEKVIVQAFADNMKKDDVLRIKNKAPIAKYDLNTQRAYLEYPDGKRIYND